MITHNHHALAAATSLQWGCRLLLDIHAINHYLVGGTVEDPIVTVMITSTRKTRSSNAQIMKGNPATNVFSLFKTTPL